MPSLTSARLPAISEIDSYHITGVVNYDNWQSTSMRVKVAWGLPSQNDNHATTEGGLFIDLL